MAVIVEDVFAERVAVTVKRALVLLDAVPRHHPFWDHTNGRATEFKARHWFARVLASHPHDNDTRWILVSLQLNICDFGAEALLVPLVRQDLSNLRWMVGATEWLFEFSNADTSAALRAALDDLGLDLDSPSLPNSASGDRSLQRSIEIARRVMAGAHIFAAARDAGSINATRRIDLPRSQI